MKGAYFLLICLTLFGCKNQSRTDKVIVQEEKARLEAEKFQTAGRSLEKIGQIYYEKNCVMCHGQRRGLHNMLRDALLREDYDFQYLKNYITKQDSLVNAGNKEAIAKRNEYNSAYLHSFELTDNEIKAILFYLKQTP